MPRDPVDLEELLTRAQDRLRRPAWRVPNTPAPTKPSTLASWMQAVADDEGEWFFWICMGSAAFCLVAAVATLMLGIAGMIHGS